MTRLLTHPEHMIWMVIGCIIPDLPWLHLKLLAANPHINPYDLRLYAMVQASLFFSLLLCAAIAVCTREMRTVFFILAANTLGHLLLDITQIKWGNGVHFFLPFASEMIQLDVLWPEHPVTIVMTVFGGAYLLLNAKKWSNFGLGLRFDATRLSLAGLLFGLYLAAPLLCISQLDTANACYLHTLREVSKRPGKEIAFDRVHYFADKKRLRIYTGEYIHLTGPQPQESGRVSLRGRFTTPDTITVSAYHYHRDRRDAASLLGLFMACLLVLQSLRITIRNRGKSLQGF